MGNTAVLSTVSVARDTSVSVDNKVVVTSDLRTLVISAVLVTLSML